MHASNLEFSSKSMEENFLFNVKPFASIDREKFEKNNKNSMEFYDKIL